MIAGWIMFPVVEVGTTFLYGTLQIGWGLGVNAEPLKHKIVTSETS